MLSVFAQKYMEKNIKDMLAVLVVSCDKYSDLWEPFFECFRRFWPGCLYEIYLVSNTKKSDYDEVANILTGKDVSWSDNLIYALKQIKEDYVLLFLDDLFLHHRVNTKEVSETLAWAIESGVNYIRMNPMKNKADKPFNSTIGIISKKAIYRTSTVVSVWKKSVLLDLLKEGESAWDFEVCGSPRSDKYDGFYAAWKTNFPVTNTVIKGKWRRGAVRKFKSLGIEIDLTSRKVMSFRETTGYVLKIIRSHLLSCLPAKHRRHLKNFVLRGKNNY